MKINWTYLIGGFAIAAIIFLFGWFAKPSAKSSAIVKETIVRDTTEIISPPVKIDTAKIIKPYLETINDLEGQITGYKTVYKDSLMGEDERGFYKIKHQIKVSDKVESIWNVVTKPVEKIIKENVVTDSVQTLVETKYIDKPLFLNEWFYVSLAEIGIIILLILAGI